VTDAAPIRVLVADDEPLQRSGWRLALDAQSDLEVVAEANDGVHAMSILRRTPVDVAVVDVDMPRMSGLQLAARVPEDARVRLTQRPPVTRVVLMTALDLDRYAPLGLEAGADAVLYKDVEPERLFAAIRDAAAKRRAPA
jgi:DNA-binding NarL/FixJ family response regulator